MYLIFDTETTGLPKNFNAPITDTDNWPRVVQIAWQLHDVNGNLIENKDFLIIPDNFDIPFQAEQIHGISTDLAREKGVGIATMLTAFSEVLKKAKFIVGQNIGFDINVMGCELFRYDVHNPMIDMPVLDTCTEKTAQLCKLPGGRGGKFKLPTLTELHEFLFNESFGEAHNATADVEATTRCFLELIRKQHFTQQDLGIESADYNNFFVINSLPFAPAGLSHLNLKDESEKIRKRQAQGSSDGVVIDKASNLKRLESVRFSHLHCHSQFSILQSTTGVSDLIAKAAAYRMPGVALTDMGNMMAAFHFVSAGDRHNSGIKSKIDELKILLKEGSESVDHFSDDGNKTQVKTELTQERISEINRNIIDLTDQLVVPIVGAELFVCNDRSHKEYKDNGYLVPLLAKNKDGYHNLAKLASAAYVEGFYYVPRVDKQIISSLKKNLIATTGGINGEIPQLILNVGESQAEEAFLWWKQTFGDDFYVELNRHGIEEESKVCDVLLKFAKKHNVKYFAANNNYYLDQDSSDAHDVLLCIKDGVKKATPIGRGRGFRYGLPNNEYYFKPQDEMKKLFVDLPEAVETTMEIVGKCEPYTLASEVLLPAFDIPEEFRDPKDLEDPKLKNGENNYLRHLTYVGAEKRYGEISPDIRDRLDFELEVIRKTGYPGYFLIVEDFIRAARKMGVSVGPGRGSAAGSAVAYCIEITNIDPIKYDLLFERFLNPERVSMPDIDIDFDDEGRGSVIQYVIDKYGSSQVAQIITYGTMAAKSSIRDAGRALDLPLPDTDRIAKLVPDMKLNKLFKLSDEELSEKLSPEQIKMAEELKEILVSQSLEGQVLRQARTLEGSMRNTGIHACGVIITPSDIREHVPVALAKDSEMWSTQFDNSVVESAGLLKMDFLGLKTLTLIKDTIKIVKARYKIDIDIENIPLDDQLTYELFQRGETVGVFQYESPGMQKHLKDLKPTEFSDLIAMNALYRPGPLEYIPSFIRRKHGEEPIVYDLDVMEEYLKETYGITVYQEQVMLLSQKLADFTKGEADVLRKAMGKKQKPVLAKMKPQFIKQAAAKGHSEVALEKIWTDWEAFASYAFNKSHSTCYAWIAYQTAFLKAHYPAEYMAAVLSNNMNDIKTVSFFMEECRRMGLTVLGPSVNESYYKFAVNKQGEIRFGMGGVKGVGHGPVKALIAERESAGPFSSVFDMVRRVNLKECNKRVLESLAMGGGFDEFTNLHRAQYFAQDDKGRSLIEMALKYGQTYQQGQNSDQISLFDMQGGAGIDIPEPAAMECLPWSAYEKLNREKEVVGIYISGHPLEDYQLEIDNFCDIELKTLGEMINELPDREYGFAGVAVSAANLESRKGNKYGALDMHDMTGNMEFRLFGEQYLKFLHFLVPGSFLYIKGNVQLRTKNYNPDGKQKEFRIQYIELLKDIREKLLSKIVLRFDAYKVDELRLEEIYNLIEKYPGSKNLYLELIDLTEKTGISLVSKSKKIQVSNEFLKELREIPGFIDFKINKSDLNRYLSGLGEMQEEGEDIIEDLSEIEMLND